MGKLVCQILNIADDQNISKKELIKAFEDYIELTNIKISSSQKPDKTIVSKIMKWTLGNIGRKFQLFKNTDELIKANVERCMKESEL
jgi:hypothetical protein